MFLNHGITGPYGGRSAGASFIHQHVFPGAEIQSLSHVSAAMEHATFEILDVQSLRPHYAMTLREWDRRFRSRRGDAARYVSEHVLRAWDLYLPGCAHAFDRGWVNAHQILAAKPDEPGRVDAALTREELLLRGET